MTSKRESVRGAGRDTAGATSVTMQVWYELQRAGETGLTIDELVDKVRPRVPAGYAWRKWLADRRAHARSRNGERRTAAVRSPPDDTPANRERAIRFTVRKSVADMTKPASRAAIKRPDGRYAMGTRKPKSVFTDDQHDFDGSISRRHVSNMQLLRVLTEPDGTLQRIDASRAGGKKQLPTISTKLAAALERWAEAHAARDRTITGDQPRNAFTE